MFYVDDDQFDQIISDAIDTMPKEHMDAVKNVAIVYADDPTPEQREELRLHHDQTLFGLYEGVPLAARQGMLNSFAPDKITIFKGPMMMTSNSLADLREQVRHTLWHELAHYFGLNHDQIHKLEK